LSSERGEDDGKRTPNALIREKSPYLLQHAYNPVNWQAWNEGALKRAKLEDKPIFLSIGYSACHWCHVMERESFENLETARILNENFVSIKVDREERPDLDEVYMKAVQLMTGSGGWPLNVFLTPDLKPIFGGTYFPPEPRHGLPPFKEVLLSVARLWRVQRSQIESRAERMFQALQGLYLQKPGKETPSEGLLDGAYEQLVLQYDSTYGGFSRAPKFPMPSHLSFLLRYHFRRRESLALSMAAKTLRAMARGGIYDQLAGGFHRYSTDRFWLPHFEKMLYDNALLAKVYLEVFQATGEAFFAQVARETLEWVLREMTSPQGGFYSAIDADTEGVEGAFYLWTVEEMKAVLGEREGEAACRYYGVTQHGNFEGKNILYLAGRADDEETSEEMHKIRLKLLEARNRRTRPAVDDKVITGWNGLMIAAMAYGYQVLREQRFLQASASAADFILNNLQKQGRLRRRYCAGEAAVEGMLEDYACLILGLLDLYEADFNPRWLREALRLNEVMVEVFSDRGGGGFFLRSEENVGLKLPVKDAYDGPMPSGNSLAASNLLRLAALTGREDLRTLAGNVFKAFSTQLEENPTAHTQMLCALDFYLSNPMQIVLVSPRGATGGEEFAAEISRHYLPHKVVVSVPEEDAGRELVEMIPLLESKRSLSGKPTVYICEAFTCRVPVTDLEALRREMASLAAGAR
jgi:hypothetical protein